MLVFEMEPVVPVPFIILHFSEWTVLLQAWEISDRDGEILSKYGWALVKSLDNNPNPPFCLVAMSDNEFSRMDSPL